MVRSRSWFVRAKLPPWRARLNHLVKHQAFDWVFCALILLNGMMVGAQTDYAARSHSAVTPMPFCVLDVLFCLSFTVELVLRVLVFRCGFFCQAGCAWNIFDLVMVVFQQVEIGCSFLLQPDDNVIAQNLGVTKMLRVLRLVRIIRLVRMLRLVRDLRLLVSSIVSSMKSLGWTVMLLAGMIYCVSLVLTQLVSDHRLELAAAGGAVESDETAALVKYYGSLGRSMLSLFQAVSGGVDWNDLVSPLVVEISWLCSVAFAFYIAFCTLAMMNVVTGIFVENVLLSARTDRDLYLVAQARTIFNTLDGGINGEMTLDGFLEKIDTPEMRELFKGIDVDPSEAASLFSLIDLDSSGAIDAEEFLRACVRLRGPAMALDTAVLVQQVRQLSNELYDHKCHVEQHLGIAAPSEMEQLQSFP